MFFSGDILDLVARGLVLAFIGLAWVVLLVRINGLRSLSKMTSFDFIMTVALGSLLAGASQADSWQKFAQPLVAMVGLFFAQFAAARLRKSSDTVEEVVQNTPVFLMRDGKFCEAAMDSTRTAKSDVLAKLREANAIDLSQVRAVVLETTGDVSVLHGDHVDARVLDGVTER